MKSEPVENPREMLALRLAQGESLRQAAAALKVPATTARRWASTAEHKARVRGLREQFVTDAVGALATLAVHAAGVLGHLLLSKDENIKYKAATAIFDRLLVYRAQAQMLETQADLLERVAAIEARSGGAMP